MLKSDPSRWTDPRHIEGERAERLVAELLTREGYDVLERRFRLFHHDVDLVARQGRTVVFLEVKARTGRRFGSGLEAVTAKKQRELVRVAAAWLQRYGRPDDVARFDVASVTGARVTWVRNAFRPGWR
jgi:putative endonuclease